MIRIYIVEISSPQRTIVGIYSTFKTANKIFNKQDEKNFPELYALLMNKTYNESESCEYRLR